MADRCSAKAWGSTCYYANLKRPFSFVNYHRNQLNLLALGLSFKSYVFKEDPEPLMASMPRPLSPLIKTDFFKEDKKKNRLKAKSLDKSEILG